MDEITKKRKWNAEAVNIVSKKRNISAEYVRQVLRGDRKGIKPDEIKKDYQKINTILNKTVFEILNK